jgi:hypothetical protein
MAKAPAARFPTALAMIESLEVTLRAPERRREHVRRVAAGVLSAVAMIAAAAGASRWERWRIAEGVHDAADARGAARAGVDANAAIASPVTFATPAAIAAAQPPVLAAAPSQAMRAERSDLPSLALPGVAAPGEVSPPPPSREGAPHDRGERGEREGRGDRASHGDADGAGGIVGTTTREGRRKLGRWNKSQDASRSGKLP